MPKDHKSLDVGFADEESSGWTASLLAEEDEFDRRTLWRLGSWAAGSVAALMVALLAAQYGTGLRGERTAFAELSRQAQQMQTLAKANGDEAHRLAAAVETLNSDRDRLYARVTVLEQGLDTVTGSLTRNSAAATPERWPTSSAPVIAAPFSVPIGDLGEIATLAKAGVSKIEKTVEAKAEATTAALPPLPTTTIFDPKIEAKILAKATPAKTPAKNPTKPPLAQAKIEAEPDNKPDIKAAGIKVAAKPGTAQQDDSPATTAAITATPTTDETPAESPVARTEFGVDIGSANSVEGLRAMWRGALKSHNTILGALQPIIFIRERHDGLGLQLRLVAGPLNDAAAAAKICARLAQTKRDCEPSVFDGQRLAMDVERPVAAAKHVKRRPVVRAVAEEPAPAPPPKPPGLSSFFSRLSGQ